MQSVQLEKSIWNFIDAHTGELDPRDIKTMFENISTQAAARAQALEDQLAEDAEHSEE